jgi:hypothetical protein
MSAPYTAPEIVLGYWMYETSGVLRPAVHAFLHDEAMTGEQIAAMLLEIANG